VSCDAPMRSSRRRRLSLRGSSTRHRPGAECLYRRVQDRVLVEPIWRVLQIAPSTYYAIKQRER
jgi:hypothetical protein